MPEWRSDIVGRLAGTNLRPESEADLIDELSQHLDEHYAELRAEGVSDADARSRALAELDAMDVTQAAREKARPWRGTNEPLGGNGRDGAGAWFDDMRYGVRVLMRNPGLAFAAIITLGIGIGANTAIFSAVNAVILRPLPFPHQEQLYKVWEENPEKGWYKQTAAPANYLDWKEGVEGFTDVAAYTSPGLGGGATLLGEGQPQLLRTSSVTGNFFHVLGAGASQGRTFRDEETWSREHLIILSDAAWHTHFGARAVLNTDIHLGGETVRVIGIMPPSFAFPANVEAWVPMAWNRSDRAAVWFRRAHWIDVVARARPQTREDKLNAELQAVAERLKHEYPETNQAMGAGLTPLHEFIVGDTHTPLVVMLAAVGLLFMIACANVGNLLLVKAAARRRELSVRRALGASSRRIAMQLMAEGLVLAIAGSVAGMVAGWALTRALESMLPDGLLSQSHFAIDGTVFLYVSAVTLVAGLLFGMIPAVSMRNTGPSSALAESSRTGAPGRSARHMANVLLVGEVAIAMMLVIGGGLLIRTFYKLSHVDPGVDTHNVLAVAMDVQGPKYDSADAIIRFFNAVETDANALPGVRASAVSVVAPMSGSGYTSDFSVAGRGREEYGSEIGHRMISPNYFATAGVPIIRGRTFNSSDRRNSTRVVIINQTVADKFFKDSDPVGQRIAFDKYPDSTSTWRTIVGVVGSEHQKGLMAPPMLEAFVPLAQEANNYNTLLLRTAGDPYSVLPSLRELVHRLDPDVALQSARSLEDIRARSLARERFLMTVLLTFAAVALFLAIVGVYGVTAQGTRHRRQEIGVRLAMGAQRGDIIKLVVSQSARLVTLGVVAGSLLGLLASRALTSLLYGITAADPATYFAVGVVLLVTGAIAAWVPANAASRSDPARVLRVE